MQLKRVVVTGLGALTPIGNTVSKYWENLSNGVSGADFITYFDASKFKTRFACELKNFDVLQFMDRKEARKIDPYTQYALVASTQAIEDAKLDLQTLDLNRIGVIWGSGIGGMQTFQNEVTEFALGDGTPRFNPFFIPKMIGNIAGGQISIKYSLRGPNFTTVSACTSSANALIDAFNYIRLGRADIFVSGGSEACVSKAAVAGFNAMKAMSERNDDPKTASRPFDADRDGFVLGEGAGAIILEELDHAIARGATIYAEMVGGGLSADAYHITTPHPEGLGIINVMKDALRDANMQAHEIDYVNVHGTSTPVGDVGETNAIVKVFGEKAAYALNISSTKSMTGHLLGAAGVIEAIACILAMKHQTVPPTINGFNRDPNIDPNLNLTFNTAQRRPIKATMSNTFGFGGHNASIIFKEYQP